MALLWRDHGHTLDEIADLDDDQIEYLLATPPPKPAASVPLLTVDEWRENLRQQGLTEEEIDALWEEFYANPEEPADAGAA